MSLTARRIFNISAAGRSRGRAMPAQPARSGPIRFGPGRPTESAPCMPIRGHASSQSSAALTTSGHFIILEFKLFCGTRRGDAAVLGRRCLAPGSAHPTCCWSMHGACRGAAGMGESGTGTGKVVNRNRQTPNRHSISHRFAGSPNPGPAQRSNTARPAVFDSQSVPVSPPALPCFQRYLEACAQRVSETAASTECFTQTHGTIERGLV